MNEIAILVVDDDETAGKNLRRLLSKDGYKVRVVKDGEGAVSLLSRESFSLVITDLIMEPMSGLELLSEIKLKYPDTEVIVVTGYASIPTAIEATKRGAYHYLEKPFRPDEVRHLASRAIEKRRLREQVKDLESRLRADPGEPVMIGRSPGIVEVVKLLKQAAKADCNVVITGESGTGKELAASIMHRHSVRAEGKFLAINCGGFTDELLANELFGHEKGAFTGADSGKAGLLETASGGTLFLDEVGDMPMPMQIKLLRAVQEQEVIRVGGNQPVPIDVRVIAATNQDLKKSVKAGIFRQDLYFRLNVISIHIPPLRERGGDVALLAHYFLDRAARRSGRDIKGVSDKAMKLLMDYEYPGNARELENIIEHAVAMARSEEIKVEDLPSDLSEMDFFSFDYPDQKIKPLSEIEREYIQWVLKQTGRNKTQAAKLLEIDRATLWRHLKRSEIED